MAEKAKRGQWVGGILFLLALPVIATTVLGFLGRYSWSFELFSHFRVQYLGYLLLWSVLLFLVGAKRLSGIVGLFVVANLAVVLPQFALSPVARAGNHGSTRVLLSNVNKWNRGHGRVLELIDQTDPDIIVLEELDEAWMKALTPLAETYPHSVSVLRPNPYGIGLWSREPLTSGETLYFVDERVPSVAARIDLGGKELLVVGVHPPAPRRRYLAERRNRELAELARLVRSHDGHVIVAGDLNNTLWSHSFSRFLQSSGLSDSSRGHGFQWSWPVGFWPLAIPIDHCLVSENVDVVGRFIGPDVGSDHYPLVVDVRFR